MSIWECEHRNTSSVSSQCWVPDIPRLPLRECRQEGCGGSSPSRGPSNSLHAGPVGKSHCCSSSHSAGQAGKGGWKEAPRMGSALLCLGEGVSVGERVVTSCHTSSPPPSLLCFSCPSCSQELCMVQIFTEHLLCARHQKYDTGTVPALMGLPVQKAIIGGHCNTGGGELWVSAYTGAMSCPPLESVSCWSWEREVEGLMAASKINKRLIYPAHAANVVFCFQKWRTNNLRFHLKAVNYSFPQHPGHQSVILRFGAHC